MRRAWLTRLAGGVAGGLTGWLWYRHFGCASGSCALSATPIRSTLQGGLLGALLFDLFLPGRPAPAPKDQRRTTNH